ncbi:MAG TPA: glycoside-pentoside-hexuronide (GPH):cation symporter, partial [SAR86 cluster bacterium]|nr:glycoside-pentoside-hexuronide (GPH):cation symporter [SAR86 cluster bacterium]
MTKSLSEKLSLKVRFGYGIGDTAICFYWSGVGFLLMYFYTDVVGISPILAGTILLIGMLWDAFTDPFMGYIAERTRTRWGVYRPYLLFGNIPLALSFILLFWVPPYEGTLLFTSLVCINILHRTCFTIVSVPFSSLTPRITSDSVERTNLTGFRMLGAQTGTILITSLAFPIIFWAGGSEGEAKGFLIMAAIASFVALIIQAITFITVQEPTKSKGIERVSGSLVDALRSVLRNKPFWLVFSATLIVGSTTLFFGKSLLYYVKYALDLHEHQGTIAFTGSVIAFLSIPVWWVISNQIGKRKTWLISMSLTFVGFIIFYLYPISTLNELLFLVALLGLSSGANGILFWSMLPDTIEYGEVHTGIRSESSLYGFMTFAQKGSIAIAAYVYGLALIIIGFIPDEIQTPETITSMKSIMTLIPAFGVATSIIFIYFYPLDSDT